MGSQSRPPPLPISRIRMPFSGSTDLGSRSKRRHNSSRIYWIRTGLNLCSGLNFPSGSHHSSAMAANFSISAASTVCRRGLRTSFSMALDLPMTGSQNYCFPPRWRRKLIQIRKSGSKKITERHDISSLALEPGGHTEYGYAAPAGQAPV